MIDIKQVMKSRTIRFAFALEALGIIQANAEELRAAIDPAYYGYFLIGVGIAVKLLRIITTTPISAK